MSYPYFSLLKFFNLIKNNANNIILIIKFIKQQNVFDEENTLPAIKSEVYGIDLNQQLRLGQRNHTYIQLYFLKNHNMLNKND